MKKILATTIIVILVAALTVGAVMAEEVPPTEPSDKVQTRDSANNRVLVDYMSQAIADELGISLVEYDAFKLTGMTLYDIAEELGIDAETVITLQADAREAALAAAEADGIIVQVQQRARLNTGNGQVNGVNGGGNGNGAGNGGQGGRHNGTGECDLSGECDSTGNKAPSN